ncbi:MAG: hypothetical protein AMK69_18735 [Nitrospira bacterium SG8_3]|nr:MAG: hypothetical protein AMK69_18735 [Nitrospira bacterium SG8_3]
MLARLPSLPGPREGQNDKATFTQIFFTQPSLVLAMLTLKTRSLYLAFTLTGFFQANNNPSSSLVKGVD